MTDEHERALLNQIRSTEHKLHIATRVDPDPIFAAALRDQLRALRNAQLRHSARCTAGVWRWHSSGNTVPDEILEQAGRTQAERAATREASLASLAELREQMRGQQHTPEQLAEMRAAFGPGATVVNVLTGEETQL